MFNIVLVHPEIPPNTGNVIRLAANTGCALHLIEPLGFSMDDKLLRRAGLDYHDLALVSVHPTLDDLWSAVLPARVYAFTAAAAICYTDVSYRAGDVLLFGPETTGLDTQVLTDPNVTAQLRIPMLAGRRSLNLSNAAAIAGYEAWRQLGFSDAPSWSAPPQP